MTPEGRGLDWYPSLELPGLVAHFAEGGDHVRDFLRRLSFLTGGPPRGEFRIPDVLEVRRKLLTRHSCITVTRCVTSCVIALTDSRQVLRSLLSQSALRLCANSVKDDRLSQV